MRKRPSRIFLLKILGLYIAALAVVYAPVVLGGKTLSPSLVQPHGQVAGRPHGFEGRTPVNVFNVDLATPAWYEQPVNRTIGRIYLGGELPLWNPYQGGGSPLAADYSTRAFFPLQVLEDISPPLAWDFFLLSRPALAGFFTFLFLSAIGLSPFGAFAGGLFYMFSGVFSWFISLEQFSNVALVLPLVLWALEVLVQRRSARAAAFLAVAFGLLLLAGQPEVALYALFLAFSYAIFRALSLYGRGRGALGTLLLVGAAFVLGFSLAAPMLLPFIHNARDAISMHVSGLGIGLEHVKNWRMIFSALTPTAMEIPADPSIVPAVLASLRDAGAPSGLFYFRVFATKGLWDWLGGFTGVIMPFFALYFFLAALTKKKMTGKGTFFFFFLFAIFVILKNMGVPPFVWLGSLPFFDRAWSPRWSGPSWVFAMAVAGAMGFDAVFGDSEAARAERRGGAAFISLGGAYALMLAMFLYFPIPSAIGLVLRSARLFSPRIVPFIAPTMGLAMGVAMVLLFLAYLISRRALRRSGAGAYAVIALILLEAWWNVPRGYDAGYIFLKLLPLLIGLLAVIALLLGRRGAALLLVPVFVISFLGVDLGSPRGLAPRTDPYVAAPYLRTLQGLGPRPFEYRVMGGYGVLMPNYAGAEGLFDLRYINALAPLNFIEFRRRFLQRLIPGEESAGSALWFTGMGKRIIRTLEGRGRARYEVAKRGIEKDILEGLPYYSLMGVRYVLMPQWFSADDAFAARFHLIHEGDVKVYENRAALPRAFVTRLYETGAGGAFTLEPGVLGRGRGAIRKAEIQEYGANFVRIRAGGLGGEGRWLLVLSDNFAPGWRAYVDGGEEPIHEVNGLLRGVLLEGGDHEVLFRYRPPGFGAGVALFVLASLVSIVMALPGRLLRRGGRKRESRP